MPMRDKFTCTVVDWNYAYDLCRDASVVIKAEGYKPEVMVGVARGGLFLARMLCDFFLLKDLFSVKMEHWGITATITGGAKLKYGLDEKARELIRGKRVIIADDITDTGESLNLAVEYVKSMGAKDVKTATMQHKTSSGFVPDFYGELIRDWKWVVYPWSIQEDMMELLEKIIGKEKRGMGLNELKIAMKEEFDFSASYTLLKEVLENMEFHGRIRNKKEDEKEVWLL